MKKIAILFFTFFKIGLFTFGGGYAMIALLKNEFVSRKKWISDDTFFDMVAIAESTPDRWQSTALLISVITQQDFGAPSHQQSPSAFRLLQSYMSFPLFSKIL